MISDDNTRTDYAGSGWDDDLSNHVAAFFNKIKAEKEKSAAERYDYFISYAREDAVFATSLSRALNARGIRVWIDQESATAPNGINRIIDEALMQCKSSILLLSPHYFAKFWTTTELSAIFALAASRDKKKRFIPIRLGISQDELLDFSVTLAGQFTLESGLEADDITSLAEKLELTARELMG